MYQDIIFCEITIKITIKHPSVFSLLMFTVTANNCVIPYGVKLWEFLRRLLYRENLITRRCNSSWNYQGDIKLEAWLKCRAVMNTSFGLRSFASNHQRIFRASVPGCEVSKHNLCVTQTDISLVTVEVDGIVLEQMSSVKLKAFCYSTLLLFAWFFVI